MLFMFIYTLPVIAEDIMLEIMPPTQKIYVDDSILITAKLINQGLDPITLVALGDGSGSGLRTPIVGWSIIPEADFQGEHPDDMQPNLGGRLCGNINPIQLDEIFTIKPNQTYWLNHWINLPYFEEPGIYHIAFYYENNPEHPMDGFEQEVVEKFRETQYLFLKSNDLIIEVLPNVIDLPSSNNLIQVDDEQ